MKDDDDFDDVDDDNGDDDDAINRWPFIGIDLGTMLSADFAAAAVLIRFPTIKLCFYRKSGFYHKFTTKTDC